uniref:Uncharacterized protein n=1 Tax=viral metagenome TaxID=1070528 RepID=A0A2V0RBA2_9ZZZZ
MMQIGKTRHSPDVNTGSTRRKGEWAEHFNSASLYENYTQFESNINFAREQLLAIGCWQQIERERAKTYPKDLVPETASQELKRHHESFVISYIALLKKSETITETISRVSERMQGSISGIKDVSFPTEEEITTAGDIPVSVIDLKDTTILGTHPRATKKWARRELKEFQASPTPWQLGEVISHKEWNKLMHIMHGNTTPVPGGPLLKSVAKVIPLKEAAPVRLPQDDLPEAEEDNADDGTMESIRKEMIKKLRSGVVRPFRLQPVVNKDTGVTSYKAPNTQECLRQWSVFQEMWSEWWIAAQVITGEYVSPFDLFPSSFTFAKRVVTPDYTNLLWQNFVPMLAVKSDDDDSSLGYNANKGIDLYSQGIHWIFKSELELVIVLLSILLSKPILLTQKEVLAMATQTPSMMKEAKSVISQIKMFLSKILNARTALRDPSYGAVKKAFRDRRMLLDGQMKAVRAQLKKMEKDMFRLSVDEDEELAKLDRNRKRTKVSMEERLLSMGLNGLPVAAEDLQKGGIQNVPELDADECDEEGSDARALRQLMGE